MQKVVFFIEPTDKDYGSASTVGNLYMNRFAIDEDAGHEIVNIHEATFETFKTHQKGTGQIILNSYDGFVKCFCFVKLTLCGFFTLKNTCI